MSPNKICGAPAPGGRRVCELAPNHPSPRHAYRREDGSVHEWMQTVASAVAGNDRSPDASPRLGQRGQIIVSQAALDRYAAARSLLPEEARRELTACLLDARHKSDGPPAEYRARSRTTGLDITARVVPDAQDPRLLVVVAVSVRDHG
jgi:hypothetical protein